ncbi:photosystem I assembly factor PSA3, chloroplastic [Impatiens glandulifera]|uniref:photosystem I assembly factor PSA3, chloroplastic n=1 Tax=Impatiens glandulifera TaxID=253017 RepID=UPI001FB12067|nr:photosystem I assembly factor PSA3, chloroplastic [Impatiens glandulifera]
MVVVTPSSSFLLPLPSTLTNSSSHYAGAANSFLFYYKRTSCRSKSSKSKSKSNDRTLSVRSYMDEDNSISGIANKIIGSLPVIGLIARIISDEGGVGNDVIDFAEFRRRVGKKCTINDSRAFYRFQERRGRSGEPLYVLLCCWLAAVGAGLLKSEEILEGVSRLRVSNDIEFEEETFVSMLNEAKERRSKLRVTPKSIPMKNRAEKALEAVFVCCFGQDAIDEEDEMLLGVMMNSVFPSIGEMEMNRIVKEKSKQFGDDSERKKLLEPKRLPKEAVQMQMKDLKFLQQETET